MDWIKEHIVYIIFVVFYILLNLTKVKKANKTRQEKPLKRTTSEEVSVETEIKKLIQQRRHESNEMPPIREMESPYRGAAHSIEEPLPRVVNEVPRVEHVDYYAQIEEQRQKIEQAKQLKAKIQTENNRGQDSKRKVEGNTRLQKIFKNKPILVQAILAKEILDNPNRMW